MPELPPVELVAMLERLGLATAAQVAVMGRRVRLVAGGSAGRSTRPRMGRQTGRSVGGGEDVVVKRMLFR